MVTLIHPSEDVHQQIMQAIYAAITEVNEMLEPGKALEKSPDTVVMGKSAKLDSMGFVTLITSVEENVERTLNETISLMDVFGDAAESSRWTVADLAKDIAELVNRVS
jgi:acyl carrier protein